MQKSKKILAVILSFVMLFCVLPVNAFATDETYPIISLNEVINLSFTESTTEYIHAFTPTESGYYSFYSFNNDTMDYILDTYGEIYSSDWSTIATDDGGNNYNFRFSVLLNANETYYFKSTTLNSSEIGNCSVIVEKSVIADAISFEITNITCFLNHPAYLPIGIITEPENSIAGDVSWEISDENIIEFTVTDTFHCEISAKSVGTATITATNEKGATASCEVTVKYPTEIKLNSPYTHEFKTSGLNVFSFTPEENAVYEISSTYSPDTYFGFDCHYDSDSNEIIPVHARISEDDFVKQIEQYNLQKDTTYYFGTNFNGVGSYTLNITKPAVATEMYLDSESIEGTIGSRYMISRDFGPEGCAYQKTTWSISDESIAKLSFDSEHFGGMNLELELLKPGTTTITATSQNGLKATCTLTVKDYDALTLDTSYTETFRENRDKTFSFTPLETGVYEFGLTLPIGVNLSCNVTDSDNNEINYIYNHSQSHYEQNIETKGSQYILEKDKTYYIRLHAEGEMEYTIMVSKPEAAKTISITSEIINGFVGTSTTAIARLGPEGCAYQKIYWSIDDETVAEISYNTDNNSGMHTNIKFLKEGTANLTATSESGLSATCTVTVTSAEEIFVDTTKSGIFTANEHSVTYKFIPKKDGVYNFKLNDSEHADTYFHIELYDKYNNSLLCGNDFYFERQVKLSKDEPYYLTVFTTMVDYPEYFMADYFINITMPPKADSMSLWCDTDVIYVNTDINVFTSFYPENSAVEYVEWSIDNTGIAYISSSSYDYAWIHCHQPGTITVTATSESGFSASCTLTIKSYTDAPSLLLNNKVSVPAKPGESVFQYTPAESGIYTFYSTGYIYTLCNLLDSDMNYITSDSCSGEGDNFYIEYYLNAGETYYITSELYSNYNDSENYNIYLKRLVPATSVRILNGSQAEGYIGNYIKLYAMLNPANAIVEELIWTVDNPDIAYIDGYYDNGGIDLCLNNCGTTTVTVRTQNGLTDSITIKVKDYSKPEYIKIQNGNNITAPINGNMCFGVDFYPDCYEQIYWSSSNPDIVSINEYGEAQFLKLGTATITATTESGLTDSCVVTVVPQKTIKLNETTKVNVTTPSQSEMLHFTPEESGYYTFYSISEYDTYGWIDEYNNEDCGSNKNFRVNVYMYAGRQYSLSVGLFGNTIGTVDVRLERLDVDTSNGDINFDGEVNALDIAWMRKLMLDIIPLDSASRDIYDINFDGSFDVRDLVRLKTLIAKNK